MGCYKVVHTRENTARRGCTQRGIPLVVHGLLQQREALVGQANAQGQFAGEVVLKNLA